LNSKLLIEAYIASQTESGLESVKKSLDIVNLIKKENKPKLIQTFLTSVSLLSKFSTPDLFNILESTISNKSITSINSQAHLALGSLVNLASTNNIYNDKIEKSFNYLIEKNNEKTLKDLNAKLVYMESLKNTRLLDSFDYVKNIENFKNSSKIILSILKYFDSLDVSNFNESLLKDLLVIFFDNKMREEIRIETLGIILDKYSHLLSSIDSPILENILHKIFIQKDKSISKEFTYYCQQIIWNKSKSNQLFK